MKKEIWKNIEWYDWMYQISDFWSVRSFRNNRWWKSENSVILKQKISQNGYYWLQLMEWGKVKMRATHRLIAIAFIPNPENKPCINHINGNKTDNRIANLEWCTVSENNTHKHRVLWYPWVWKGRFWKNHPHSKWQVIQKDLEWKIVKIWDTLSDVKRGTGINNIVAVLMGRQKTAWGFIWERI